MVGQLKKHLRNERGSSLIASLFIVMTMAIAGMELVQTTASESSTTSSNLQSANALYIGHAGLEIAKRAIAENSNPVTSSAQPFFDTMGNQIGDYSISADYANHQITVVSNAGGATEEQSIDIADASTCTTLDTSNVSVSGINIYGLAINQQCNRPVTIDKITFTWDWPAYPSYSNAYIAFLGFIYLDDPDDTGKRIYKPIAGIGGTPLLPFGSAKNGVAIPVDQTNATMSTNGIYHLEYLDTGTATHYGAAMQGLPASADGNIPHGTFTLTVTYVDGSSNTSNFTY